MSLKRIFKFAKPKNPGYGISTGFYLSVLAGRPQMPSPLEVAHPKAEGGAVEGLIAPLMPGATKEDLSRPMGRGVYALASREQKTVIKVRVLSKEEAGFDPEALARSPFASMVDGEALARIRATWTLVQLTFESHDAMISPAMAFLNLAAKRLAELTDGVVADPIAQKYMLPSQVPSIPAEDLPRALDHLSIRLAERNGVRVAFTLGMQKFVLPELEIRDLSADESRSAEIVLASVAQEMLNGTKIEPGDRVGTFEAGPGGLDRGQWEGIPVLELIPPRGKSVSDCLEDWLLELKQT